MAEIRIELKSELCASSGRSSGNVIDNDICFDAYGLPVIPARRIKGVLRDAAVMLKNSGVLSEDELDKLFGISGDMESGAVTIRNAEVRNAKNIRSFVDSLDDKTKKYFIPFKISGLYTMTKGQTAIDEETGSAQDHSTRFSRVLRETDPITGEALCLYADVTLNDNSLEEAFTCCCQAVRHMGLMRNRGLGWVRFYFTPDAKNDDNSEKAQQEGGEELYEIEYHVSLDSSISLPGCNERLLAIPGRSVIGCMAGRYIRKYLAGDGTKAGEDKVFCDLFLNGTCRWSDISIIHEGKLTDPVPLMLVYLNDSRRFYNRLVDEEDKSKQTSLDGRRFVRTGTGFEVLTVANETEMHLSHKSGAEKSRYYSVTAVASGYIFGGSVVFPEKYRAIAEDLLKDAQLSFGGSKSAQYSHCKVVGDLKANAHETGKVEVKKGEPVFFVLASDALIMENGQVVCDNKEIRRILSQQEGVEGVVSDKEQENYNDYVQYHTISGYNAMWHLQKMQYSVITGGSVFCLTAEKDGEIPAQLYVGENRQEGMGKVKIYSLADMMIIRDQGNEGITVDAERSNSSDRDNEACIEFEKAVILATAKQAVIESALDIYYDNIKFVKESELKNGRLRLMLENAENFHDFINRVSSIKREKARKKSEEFIDAVLGAGIYKAALQEIENANVPVAEMTLSDEHVLQILSSLLGSDEALLDMVKNYGKSVYRQFVENNWKKLLLLVLQAIYYGNKESEAKRG